MTSKDLFYEELAAHFTKEEQGSIKAKCTSMEVHIGKDYDLEKYYRWMSSIVKSQRYGYHKCMFMLENALSIFYYSSYIQDSMDNSIVTSIIEQIKKDTLPIIQEQLSILDKDKQTILASNIATSTYKIIYYKDIIGDLKPLYEDLLQLRELSIYNQNPQNKLDKITFTKHEGGSLIFRSGIITKMMQNDFYHYIMRLFPESSFKSEKEIRNKIHKLHTAENYIATLAIRNIAELLINNGIITKTSSKNNSLGLVNNNGEYLEFPNSIGVFIFDIAKKIKLINNDKNDLFDGTEKRDFIKSRLKTSANSKYQFDIDSILEGFDRFYLWLFKNK